MMFESELASDAVAATLTVLHSLFNKESLAEQEVIANLDGFMTKLLNRIYLLAAHDCIMAGVGQVVDNLRHARPTTLSWQ